MDTVSPETRRLMMAAVRQRNTKPELLVRSLAFAMGYRYRLHVKNLPGRPDIVFPRLRKVIYVHGCFWHRHGCKQTTTPETRRDFWLAKFEQNVKRDTRNLADIRELGWHSLVIWECQTKDLGLLEQTLQRFLSMKGS